jgi:3-oxoacyl-[acyl-carrier-protein] synthase II
VSGEIVITGAALATSLGITREATWAAVARGECGMRDMPAMETPLPAGKDGGQALDLPADFEPGQTREVRYLRWTLQHALADAGLHDANPYSRERCGIVLGTTLHGMRAAGRFLRNDNPAELRNFLSSNILADATKDLGFTGFGATTCSACSSSLGSIAMAITLLRAGALDVVLAGGYDTVSEYVYGGFNSLRLVAEGPLRPFAKNRQGMKLAEGYGIVILERADDAARRRAQPLAAILGYGESADAHHLTQPHPQGDGASRAMRAALKSANLNAGEIDLVAAHATGTPDNDAGEHAALSATFGERLPAIPVVAFKSHLGHTLGGAGAVELILAAMALRDQKIPACANSRKEDLEFADLNLATETHTATIETSLNTSLGFGGANTCVVLGKKPRGTNSRFELSNQAVISGIGVLHPNFIGNDAFLEHLRNPAPLKAGAIAESAYIHLLNARRVRRMSEYVKLTLAATSMAMSHARIDDPAAFAGSANVLLGTNHGSATYCGEYYSGIVKQGFIGANPMMFAEGVPNAAAAHLSLMLGVKGSCQTVIGSRTAGMDALRLAMYRIQSGEWSRVIVGAAEEFAPLVNRAYSNCGLHASAALRPAFTDEAGFISASAAVSFIIESRESAMQRGAKILATIDCGASSFTPPQHSAMGLREIMRKLGSGDRILSSANNTWIDRAELAAARCDQEKSALSAISTWTGESFSVTAMLGIAAAILARQLPGTSDPIDAFNAICTDFTGSAAGLRISL